MRSNLKATFALYCILVLSTFASPNVTAQGDGLSLSSVVEMHQAHIRKGSVKTVGPIIVDLLNVTGGEGVDFLEAWQAKELWYVKETGQFVRVQTQDKQTYELFSFDGSRLDPAKKSDIKQVKPNGGLRARIGDGLVIGRIKSADPEKRQQALTSIQRKPKAKHFEVLQQALGLEVEPALRKEMGSLLTSLTIEYGTDEKSRIKAIESLTGDISLESRASLNKLLTTKQVVVKKSEVAEAIKDRAFEFLIPNIDLDPDFAYGLLVQEGLVPKRLTSRDIKGALEANITDGKIAGFAVTTLNSEQTRMKAYNALVDQGRVVALVTDSQRDIELSSYAFLEVYDEESSEIVEAAQNVSQKVARKVGINQVFDLGLDGLSLASIYFLAAIGLAITFGVMRVINMAHGEFIMMGAYTGYVVQLFISNYTLSIFIALPLAFVVTFLAGVLMERLVIRHLYKRPLETLLATFGISIALQQLAKNIFGTQARPLTAPSWLEGSLVFNEVVSVSFIRVAIFVLAVFFFVGLVFILNRTRLGLETRAVTQNPQMAASMGINPDRINMLTFGLGSGIAGIAGVAIGLFSKVTSELGTEVIVQSFMTVVVGGVGNLFGALFGATMIGFLQKGIEWFNPSNTLAAQTYMIIFIIIFIQFRPRGIIARKGRTAED